MTLINTNKILSIYIVRGKLHIISAYETLPKPTNNNQLFLNAKPINGNNQFLF